ncbi:hypothetical protein AAE485_09245 [Acidithiobacillus ferriphilus]|uniref:hypothetical protein n=1 Tax=Acidithiobacillus ferriphilus TaxID=1689834 RepID=UPI00390C628E
MIQHTQQAFSAQKPARNDERGAILVITLVLVLVITIAVLALMYLTRNNVLISSNMAVQSAAQEATDQGVTAANTSLQILPNWPEITSPGTWYQPLPSNANGPTRPTVPPASFWSNCTGTTCASIPVKYGSFNFNVQYVMYPAGALATQVGGNEQNQTGTGPGVQSMRYYVVYVHTSRTNGGGLGVTVQAILRKVQ